MHNRALQAEKAKSELAAAEAEQRREKEMELAAELDRQIQANTAKKEQLQREEREKQRARHRAASDATERPAYDSMVETFERELNINGTAFRAVKLSHPENGLLVFIPINDHLISRLYRGTWHHVFC